MLNFRCIGNFPLYKYIEFPARNRLVAQAKKAQACKCLSFFRFVKNLTNAITKQKLQRYDIIGKEAILAL